LRSRVALRGRASTEGAFTGGMSMDTVLVVNAGSSSVKFQVFAIEGDAPKRLVKGQVEGIRTRPKLRALDGDGKSLIEQAYAPEQVPDVAAALRTAGAWLRDALHLEPVAVGHRVVHGGPQYHRPMLIDAEVIERLESYVPLAPLHQPNNLAPIRALLSQYPDLPQIACFDTAFHREHDPVVDHYAIPERLYRDGVRRYGFHGLSYEYVASRLRSVAPGIAAGRVIVAHLGSGASMCALSDGRSIESTMGFTALDGLPMGTRSGQIDPGVVLYLLEQAKMSSEEVRSLLYGACGLIGLSGSSSDVRELDQSSDPRAHFALDYFAYRVGLYAGQLAAALGGLDAFVFTAGIGENSASMRCRIVERLGWLGAVLDPPANDAGQLVIAKPTSRIGLFIVPTDEELMIARHTLALLGERKAGADRSETTEYRSAAAG
jgi:acetate kinase